ncbi:diguanylate cyclase domain-containing protein [Salinisphaera sp. SPP-AMP-43]|uniref:sensor domain-containing diguanylate cyclase n=1 Tax=Salinisphaera sp. SPP-AMP-43 TaxID=3121288 RepID=UPI003C6E9A3D
MESIQAYGALVAVNRSTGRIARCSDNIADWFGWRPELVLGQPAEQVFGAAWPELERLCAESPQRRAAEVDLSPVRTVSGHQRGAHYILEFEARSELGIPWWDEAGRIDFLARLANTHSPAETMSVVADTLFAATGYDRVMVYRFLDNWDGEVIEQRCQPGVEGFYGLRFPAQDIPENARRLYTVNWQRLIADTESVPARLCAAMPDAEPLDMTFAMLRSVHPIHIQYLQNMQVRGSFSVSLIVDGQLWGLVTCHHRTAKRLGAHARLAIEEMARIACLHLDNLAKLENATLRSALRERLSLLNRRLDPGIDAPGEALAEQLGSIAELLNVDGLRLRWGEAEYRTGELPGAESLAVLDQWLDQMASRTRHTEYDRLPTALADQAELGRQAAGMLYLPIEAACDLLALRKEQVETITWAGHQPEPDAHGPSPRHSFAAWSESVRHRSEPWGRTRLQVADELRATLSDYLQATRHKELAYQDPLTGVANRHAFEQYVANCMAACERDQQRFALHLIDLDRFKTINDTYGHNTGDILLKEVALLMAAVVGKNDIVARLGGDEFAVLQPDIDQTGDTRALAERIATVMARPMVLEGHDIRIGASVGTAVFPDDAQQIKALYKIADAGLYAAKPSQRGRPGIGYSL